MKKIMALLLCLCTVLCLAACGGKTPDEVMAEALEATKNLQSESYDLKMDMTLTADGQTMSYSFSGSAKETAEPKMVELDLNMNMQLPEEAGGSIDSNIKEYVDATDGKYSVFTGMSLGDGGETSWLRQDFDGMETIEQYDAAASFSSYIEMFKDFTEAGTETVSGCETTRYDGVIGSEDFAELFETSGASEQLAAFGITGDAVNDLIGSIGDIPISIWVDTETCIPMKYTMDMAPAMSGLFEAMSSSLDSDSAAALSSTTIDVYTIEMTVTGVNNVDEIVIPPEALDAPSYEDMLSSLAPDSDTGM